MSVQRRSKGQALVSQGAGPGSTIPADSEEIAKPAGHVARHATYDEVALRAYQLFEERGGEPGRDWDDWFQAERELWKVPDQQIESMSATERHVAA